MSLRSCSDPGDETAVLGGEPGGQGQEWELVGAPAGEKPWAGAGARCQVWLCCVTQARFTPCGTSSSVTGPRQIFSKVPLTVMFWDSVPPSTGLSCGGLQGLCADSLSCLVLFLRPDRDCGASEACLGHLQKRRPQRPCGLSAFQGVKVLLFKHLLGISLALCFLCLCSWEVSPGPSALRPLAEGHYLLHSV